MHMSADQLSCQYVCCDCCMQAYANTYFWYVMHGTASQDAIRMLFPISYVQYAYVILPYVNRTLTSFIYAENKR